MDYIRFADDSRYLIENFASIGDTVISPLSESRSKALILSLTEENLRSVDYLHDDDVIGVYHDLHLTADPVRVPDGNGKYYVVISMQGDAPASIYEGGILDEE